MEAEDTRHGRGHESFVELVPIAFRIVCATFFILVLLRYVKVLEQRVK